MLTASRFTAKLYVQLSAVNPFCFSARAVQYFGKVRDRLSIAAMEQQHKRVTAERLTTVESVVTEVSSTCKLKLQHYTLTLYLAAETTVTTSKEIKEVWSMELEEPLAHKWKRPNDSMLMVQRLLEEGMTPIDVLKQLLPCTSLPDDLTNTMAMQFIIGLLNDSSREREKLPQYNTFQDAVELVRYGFNFCVSEIIVSGKANVFSF